MDYTAREAPAAATFAAAVLLRDSGGDFAAVFSPTRGEWGPPGGRLEPGESPREAAVRELGEEVGLVVEPSALIPYAIERFVPQAVARFAPRPGRETARHLQVYRLTLATRQPRLRSSVADALDPSWLTAADFAARCGEMFWWPVAARLLTHAGPIPAPGPGDVSSLQDPVT